jgi:hypothetical protein
MDLLTSSAGGDGAKCATREKSKARGSALIGGLQSLAGERLSPPGGWGVLIMYCDGSYKG